MIDLKIVEQLHQILINEFGGSSGIRDLGGLKAAIARPFATFDLQDLYPTPIEKAAPVFESIIINHPFMDGNKRTAYVLMRLILLQNGFDLDTTQQEKYKMTIAASKSEIRFEEIKEWLKSKLTVTA